MEKIEFTIKPEDKRNEMHFEVQLKNRAHVFKPKKGKGSYNRKEEKKRIQYDE